MARVGILPSLVLDILPTVLNNVRVKLHIEPQ
jgi:hypothetical protein